MNKVEKMEQALDLALSLLDLKEGEAYKTVRQQDIDAIKAARAMPKRQCDVGTAEEQAKRFGKLCIKYYNEDESCNRKCPLMSLDFIKGFPRCQAHWTQMPYESEAKDARR